MKPILCAVVLAATALGGCTHVARDLRHPGGAIGGVLDDRMFDASKSKQLVLLRYAILSAMVARGGTVYARDKREADAYVDYMVNTAEEINILAGHIYAYEKADGRFRLACTLRHADPGFTTDPKAYAAPESITSAQFAAFQTVIEKAADQHDDGQDELPPERSDQYGCLTYKVNFESDLPMMEKRLFRLAMAALPQKEAKRFLDYATKGDIVGAVISAFGFTTKSLDGLHSGAAVHRTGLELTALQFNDAVKPHVVDRKEHCVQNLHKLTVYEASACMGLPTDTLWVGKHDQRGDYIPEVNAQVFEALMRNMRDSCRMIPFSLEDDETTLRDTRNNRIDDCNSIEFIPRARWQTDAQVEENRRYFHAEWAAGEKD